jgi:hypothetical protein
MNHEFKITTIGNKGRNELLELLKKMPYGSMKPQIKISQIDLGLKIKEEVLMLGENRV